MADNVIENLADRLAKLPGIGSKSAKRLAFHIVGLPSDEAERLAEAIMLAKTRMTRCTLCGNFSEKDICPICSSEHRDKSKIMVVNNVKDIDSFEGAMCYDGLYFVLHNEAINPLKGIGPAEIGAEHFIKRLADEKVKEIILALSTGVEKDQTALYLTNLAMERGKRVTRISQGIPVGGLIEYFDPTTIKRAYEGRTEIEL